LKRTLATATLALLLAAPTSQAHAATWSKADAVGDATAQSLDPLTGEQTYAPSTDRSADVVRTTIRHQRRAVVLTLRLADVDPTGASSVVTVLQTPVGRFLAAASSSPGSYTFMLMPMSGRGARDGVRCTDARADFDDAADTVTVSVPRACIGRPRWVQVGALATSTDLLGALDTAGDPDGAISETVDDALRDGGHARRPMMSPKVRVG
jgi:hypothetical protein